MASLVQAVGSTNSTAEPFTVTVGTSGLGSNVTAGSLLVLVVHTYSNSVTVVDVTDDKSNTWVEAVTARSGSITERVQIWYATNVAAGATAITVDQSGSASRKWHVYEVSGFTDWGALTVITSENASNSSAPSLTLTSVEANSFVIGGISIQDQSFTPGGAYTQAYNGDGNYRQSGQYDADSGAAGNVTVDCTLGGATNWNFAAVAFGEQVSGGSIAPHSMHYHLRGMR